MRAVPERHVHDARLDPMSPERVALRAMLRYDPGDTEEPALPPRPERPGTRKAVVLALGIVEAGVISAALLAGSLFLVASPSAALPAQERLVSAFTEADSLVEVRRADLEGQVQRGEDSVRIADFPVEVVVPREQAVDADGDLDPARLTSALLASAAAKRYASGPDSLEGASADPVFAGLSRTLTADAHASARDGLMVLGTIAVVVALALIAVGGRRGWAALGLALVIGGLFGAGAATGLGWALANANTGAALRGVELAIAETLLIVPFRNGLIVAGAGVVIVLAGFVRPRRTAS